MAFLKCGDVWAGDAAHCLTPIRVLPWAELLNSWNVLVTELGTVGETLQVPLFLCSHGLSSGGIHRTLLIGWMPQSQQTAKVLKGPVSGLWMPQFDI